MARFNRLARVVLFAFAAAPLLLTGCKNRQQPAAEPPAELVTGPGVVDRPFGAPVASADYTFRDDIDYAGAVPPPAASPGSPAAAPAVPEVTFTPTGRPIAADFSAANPAPGVGVGGTTHLIRKGDTLWSLAQRYYGDGRRWTDLRDANPGVNPNRLRVGDELRIP